MDRVVYGLYGLPGWKVVMVESENIPQESRNAEILREWSKKWGILMN